MTDEEMLERLRAKMTECPDEAIDDEIFAVLRELGFVKTADELLWAKATRDPEGDPGKIDDGILDVLRELRFVKTADWLEKEASGWWYA